METRMPYPRRLRAPIFEAAMVIIAAFCPSIGRTTEYEIIPYSFDDGDRLTGYITTDGTLGPITSENLLAAIVAGPSTTYGLEDTGLLAHASPTAITLAPDGWLSASRQDRFGQETVAYGLSWREQDGKQSLTADFSSLTVEFSTSDKAAPSRFVAVASAPLFRPLDQNRRVRLDLNLDEPCSNEFWCPATSDADVARDFETYYLSANIGGLSANQSSAIRDRRITASGSLLGPGSPALRAILEEQEFDFSGNVTSTIDFQVTQPISYSLEGTSRGSAASIALIGPDGRISRDLVEFGDGVFEIPVSRGVLPVGNYTLHALATNTNPEQNEAFGFTFVAAPLPEDFYPIASIRSTNTTGDLWPVGNLVQGPGIGIETNSDPAKTATGVDGNWVTDACNFPCDFFEENNAPVIVLDLGEDRVLHEIDVWGYDSTNANGVSEFSLRFATEADGLEGLGQTISYSPTFSGVANDDVNRQPFVFDEIVAARYVEFTARDNFFVAPGDGETPGGDRVGLGEIAFPVYSLGTLPGDFDGSNTVDIADIDILTRSIADGSQDAIFDLNLDGAINSDDIRHWSTALARTWIGDADLDGKFDSKDFVIVFTAAEYDDGIPNNSTWSTGDWNGDGDFNSGDFVFAFVENGFEKGARIGVVSVPEPDHCMPLILVAVAAVIRQAFRKRRA